MLLTPYVTLNYTNAAKQELFLAPFSTFWCEKCEEDLKNQIYSEKQVDTHGKFFTGMSLDERRITLTGFVKHEINIHVAERTLHTVFNPTVSGTLFYKNSGMGLKREIECRVDEMPKVYWSNKRLKFDINLICVDPFWKGESVVQHIALTLKKFKFILSIPKGGMSFGVRKRQLESEFQNAGNVESGFQAVFRARGGTVTNPEIRNEVTGERIRLNYTMQKDDVITVLNTLQEKRVEVNGLNGFGYIDAAVTDFFKIGVGTNRISYYADENINNLYVYLKYIPSYTHAEV